MFNYSSTVTYCNNCLGKTIQFYYRINSIGVLLLLSCVRPVLEKSVMEGTSRCVRLIYKKTLDNYYAYPTWVVSGYQNSSWLIN